MEPKRCDRCGSDQLRSIEEIFGGGWRDYCEQCHNVCSVISPVYHNTAPLSSLAQRQRTDASQSVKGVTAGETALHEVTDLERTQQTEQTPSVFANYMRDPEKDGFAQPDIPQDVQAELLACASRMHINFYWLCAIYRMALQAGLASANGSAATRIRELQVEIDQINGGNDTSGPSIAPLNTRRK